MKKIILYALGETLLVVIGILLAVQINNWNTQRKLDQVEKTTLTRLFEDLKNDQHRYEFLEESLIRRIAYCDSALQILNSSTNRQERINLILIPIIEFFLLEPNTITYDEMINTGRLYSLSNDTLRSNIIDYYRQVNKWGTYAERNNSQIRMAMTQPELNDYWILKRRLLIDGKADPQNFPWLDQRYPVELKDIESLIYLTKKNLNQNRSSFSYLGRQCTRLTRELETLLK
ncbi:MAG: DUF6090 family protein [Cyclobacteriaceae bacterium]